MPFLFAFVPFRGVAMTESITAALKRGLGKFCRADDLDLVNGAKNRSGRDKPDHDRRGPMAQIYWRYC
jgi:hypothetical protein